MYWTNRNIPSFFPILFLFCLDCSHPLTHTSLFAFFFQNPPVEERLWQRDFFLINIFILPGSCEGEKTHEQHWHGGFHGKGRQSNSWPGFVYLSPTWTSSEGLCCIKEWQIALPSPKINSSIMLLMEWLKTDRISNHWKRLWLSFNQLQSVLIKWCERILLNGSSSLRMNFGPTWFVSSVMNHKRKTTFGLILASRYFNNSNILNKTTLLFPFEALTIGM